MTSHAAACFWHSIAINKHKTPNICPTRDPRNFPSFFFFTSKCARNLHFFSRFIHFKLFFKKIHWKIKIRIFWIFRVDLCKFYANEADICICASLIIVVPVGFLELFTYISHLPMKICKIGWCLAGCLSLSGTTFTGKKQNKWRSIICILMPI